MSHRSFDGALKVFEVGPGSQEVIGRPLWIAEMGQSTGHKGFGENIHRTDLRNVAHTASAALFCSPVSVEELAQHNGML